MIVLGINAYGHDAAAVLLVDGRIAFAAQQERFDRVRHSAAFPAEAIAAALSAARVRARDVDAVAFPWSRGMARARKALHLVRGLPRSLAFLREPPDDLLPDRRGYLRAMAGLRRDLRAAGITAPVRRVPHHLAHAASAALVLPEARGACLTADGMGEWTTAATWRVEDGLPRRLRHASYPHSAGKAYAAVTRWLGFRPEADEGKTMGLAAYGDPASPGAEFARGLLRPDPERLLRVATDRFGFPWGEARLYGDAFLRAVGPARRPEEDLRPGDADVARGIQDAVEAFALDASRRLLEETGARALALAGGLFLNCSLNGRLLREAGVPVLPVPAAGDSGAALGAAALVHRRTTGSCAAPLSTLRLGSDLGDGPPPDGAGGPLGLEDLAREVAARVRRGDLVGVARGRAEFGPRALGGRSVLARADDATARDRLNEHKGRERWRPVAPVVRLKDLGRFFEPAVESPWMITTLRARAAGRDALPGGVHADGSARVQTVTAEGEPFLHALLGALEASGSAPAVLDTSLNRRGEPIVETAAQALDASRAMRLDALVLGDRVVNVGRLALISP